MSDADNELLSRLIMTNPCDVPWSSMEGDERSRFCGQCKLNVYNIAQMSSKEAANLIRSSEDRICLRLYRRSDGTVLTDNCPRALKRIRDRVRATVAVLLTLVVSLGLLSSAQAQGLVGARLDPGGYSLGPDPAVEQSKRDSLVWIWQICSASWLAYALIKRRSSIVFIGIGLAVIAGVLALEAVTILGVRTTF